jgi:hypothetical protein
MKVQALLVIRKFCGDANRKLYHKSLLRVYLHLKEDEEIIQDYKLFMHICLLLMEELATTQKCLPTTYWTL